MDSKHSRSPMTRAHTFGSAKTGVEHWTAERVSAAALMPLTLWLVASLIAHTNSGYAAFVAWLRAPFVASAIVLLLIALFHHTALGLSVVVEDYVHSQLKFVALLLVRLMCFAAAVAGIVATLRIALGT